MGLGGAEVRRADVVWDLAGAVVDGRGLCCWCGAFLRWETRLVARGKEPLVDPALLRNKQFAGGLTMFFFQYLLQMGCSS